MELAFDLILKVFYTEGKNNVSYLYKLEFVKNFQTASLHRNDKQTIFRVGGGKNGKRR